MCDADVRTRAGLILGFGPRLAVRRRCGRREASYFCRAYLAYCTMRGIFLCLMCRKLNLTFARQLSSSVERKLIPLLAVNHTLNGSVGVKNMYATPGAVR